jgi:hypothetical protein
LTRTIPSRFVEKLRRVQAEVDSARVADHRHFGLTGEVVPGVRLVVTNVEGTPLVFTLWAYPQDISEICSDASVPATAALLAVDGSQARAATSAGHTVDLAQFTRSQSNPSLYYALFDYVSHRQVHSVLHRLVPGLEPDPTSD